MRYFLLSLVVGICAQAQDLSDLLRDRRAIEQVYHAHRTGTKTALEQVLRPEELKRLVAEDLRKEEVLKLVYGLEIGRNQIQAEVERINRTTRAPEMLAELKAALGNDPDRIARTMVKPLLVDRKLRESFENDPRLHGEQRKLLEALRAELRKVHRGKYGVQEQVRSLQSAGQGALTHTTWSLANKEGGGDRPTKEPSFRNLNELSPELRNVLQVQLRGPGDVSAVIEAPSEFLLFLSQDRTETTLSTTCLSIPKRSFEQWLQSFGPNPTNQLHAGNSAQ